jgi:hypothetical protein
LQAFVRGWKEAAVAVAGIEIACDILTLRARFADDATGVLDHRDFIVVSVSESDDEGAVVIGDFDGLERDTESGERSRNGEAEGTVGELIELHIRGKQAGGCQQDRSRPGGSRREVAASGPLRVGRRPR